MYLWLHCEGWIRFGPYEAIFFDRDFRTIRDKSGNVIAKSEDGHCWIVPTEEYANWRFQNPMITRTKYRLDKMER